jgi:hypothetical protein
VPGKAELVYQALDVILDYENNSNNFTNVVWPGYDYPELLCSKPNGSSPVKK